MMLLLSFGWSERSDAQCSSLGIVLNDTACPTDTLSLSLSGNQTIESYEWDLCPRDLTREPVVTNFGNIQNGLTYPRNLTLIKDAGIWYGFINNISSSVLYRLTFGGSLDNTPVLDTVNFTPSASNPGNCFSKIQFRKEGSNWYGIQVTEQERLLVFDFGTSLANNNINTTVYLNPFGLLDNPREVEIVVNNDSVFALAVNLTSEDISILRFGTSISNAPISGYNESIIEDSSLLNNSLCIEVIRYCDDWMLFAASPVTDRMVRINFGPTFNGSASAELVPGTISNPQSMDMAIEGGHYYIYMKTNSGPGIIRADFGNDLNSDPTLVSLGNYGGTINGGLSFDLEMAQDSSKHYCFVANSQNNLERIVRLAYPDSCLGSNISTVATPSWNPAGGGWNHVSFSGLDSVGNSYISGDSVFVHPPANVNFMASGVCQGDSTYFTDASTSNDSIIAWLWDFGDGNSSNTQHPVHLFADSGMYSVSLKVTTGSGCITEQTINMFIFGTPVASFAPDSTCARVPISLNEASSAPNDSIVDWEWTFINGSANGSQPEIILDTTGNQQVSLKIESSQGCVDSLSQTVFIKEAPHVAYNIGSTCLNDTTSFTNSSTHSGSLTYSWSFGDGGSSVSTSPNHLYAGIGNYSSVLVCTATNTCSDSMPQEVVISNSPNVQFGTIQSATCTRSSIQFVDNSTVPNGMIIQWIWSFGDATGSGEQNPEKSYASPDDYIVKLEAFSGTNCSSTDSVELNVLPSPILDVSILGYCTDNLLELADVSSFASQDSAASYQWDVNGSMSAQASTSLLLQNESAVHLQYTLTTDSGCIQSLDTLLTILDGPTSSLQNDGSGLLCTNLDTPFSADLSLDPNDSVLTQGWKIYQGGNIFDSAQSNTYVLNSPSQGDYDLVYAAFTEAGCRTSDSTSVKLGLSPDLDIEANNACVLDTVRFTDNYSGSNYDWNWLFGDGFTSSEDDPNHVFIDTGALVNTLTLTHKGNGCYDTSSVIVMVAPEPQVDFLLEGGCQGLSSTLFDLSEVVRDTITAWIWTQNDVTIGIGKEVNHIFSSEGEQVVELSVRTAFGCRASSARSIDIKSIPELDFEWNPLFGSTPFDIELSPNDQTNWESLQWIIDAEDTLLGPTIKWLVEDTSAFSVQLIGISQDGCSANDIKTLQFSDPFIDLAIRDLNISIVNGVGRMEVSVVNLGTVFHESVRLEASVNQKSRVVEELSIAPEPGTQLDYTFSSLFDLEDEEISSACVTLVFDGSEDDVDLTNNYGCNSTLNENRAFSPYPNPSIDYLIVPYFLHSEQDEVFISLTDMNGKLVLHEVDIPHGKGLHLVQINTSKLSGIHLIVVQLGTQKTVFKIFNP